MTVSACSTQAQIEVMSSIMSCFFVYVAKIIRKRKFLLISFKNLLLQSFLDLRGFDAVTLEPDGLTVVQVEANVLVVNAGKIRHRITVPLDRSVVLVQERLQFS